MVKQILNLAWELMLDPSILEVWEDFLEEDDDKVFKVSIFEKRTTFGYISYTTKKSFSYFFLFVNGAASQNSPKQSKIKS